MATGLIGGFGLLAILVFGGPIGNFIFVTVISLCMLFEFCSIAFGLGDERQKRALLLAVGSFICLANQAAEHFEFELMISSFLVVSVYFLFSAKRHEGRAYSVHFNELLASVFGLIYLVFVPLFIRKIYEYPRGIHWMLLFLFIVFAGDTGAYFAGRQFGKHPLYPAVSPKKTVEGAVGGLLSGLLVCYIYKISTLSELGWGGATALALIVGVVAQMGDLTESLLKRSFDKKDSGSLLPGHGGFLDRFDGVVFSAPVMYACIRVFIS